MHRHYTPEISYVTRRNNGINDQSLHLLTMRKNIYRDFFDLVRKSRKEKLISSMQKCRLDLFYNSSKFKADILKLSGIVIWCLHNVFLEELNNLYNPFKIQ